MKLPDFRMPDLAGGVPSWTPLAALGLSTVVLLLWSLRTIRRGRAAARMQPVATVRSGLREAAEAAGPFAFLGTCGMLLSLHGLYGYATGNMGLAWYWALPLMAIFDVAEVACFASLYLAARTEDRWTKPMRRTRRMAWLLVTASSAMNAAHAPGNTISLIVFALVPIVSLKLIEHELESRLAANAEDDEQGAPPGLIRLIELYYQRFWADAFARLGFDPTGRGNAVHADARLRVAALRLRDLRRAIEAEETLEKTATGRRGRRAQEQAKKATRAAQDRAELAIDVAGIAGDDTAQLTLARHLVTRGHVGELATMDVENPEGIMTLLDKLAIVPSAEAIAAGTRAAQAERRLRKAEEARDAALAALAAAEERTALLLNEAAEAQAAAERKRAAAETQAAKHLDEADTATQRAEEAAEAATAAIEQRDRLAAEIEELTQRAAALQASVKASSSTQEATQGKLSQLRQQIQTAAAEAARHQAAAETARTQAEDARTALNTARAEAEKAQIVLSRLQKDVNDARGEADRAQALSTQRTEEVRRLEKEANKLRDEAAAAAQAAEQARTEAQKATEERNAALTALHTARHDIMDALTSPEDLASPEWKSEAKMRGWRKYLHTVRTENREPTDAELAGDERDPSTARRWLGDFRTELARMTAAALPAQQDAHSHTGDNADSLVSA